MKRQCCHNRVSDCLDLLSSSIKKTIHTVTFTRKIKIFFKEIAAISSIPVKPKTKMTPISRGK